MTIRLIDQGDFIEVIGEIYRLNGNIWMASSRVYKEKIGKFKSGEIKDNPIDIHLYVLYVSLSIYFFINQIIKEYLNTLPIITLPIILTTRKSRTCSP